MFIRSHPLIPTPKAARRAARPRTTSPASRHGRTRPEVEFLEDRLLLSVVYDESVSPDISNDQAAPTPIALAPGTNSVKGVTGGSDGQDWVKVHVPAGMNLSSFVLAVYESTDGQGFTGVQAGPAFVGSPFDAASFLGYAHFGTAATNPPRPTENLVGADLLPIMADPAVSQGAQGFTVPLATGDYTFLFQQLGPALTTYQFDFVLTAAATPTTTSLTAAPAATTGGQLVTFTATVSPSPGAAGTVTFLDNGAPIPGGSNVALAGGVATFSTSTLAVGSHPVTAAYSGGGGFAASMSSTQTVVISGAAAPPQVAGIVVNGGLTAFAAPQHSRIINVQVSFDQAVQLDANALALSVHTTNVSFGGAAQPAGVGALPTLVIANSADNKIWTVTFAGSDAETGTLDGLASLKDGVYDFTIDATKVHPIGNPGVNMAAATTFTFHRLFGDTGNAGTPTGGTAGVDFEAIVNSGDNLAFRNAFNNPANYRAYLDLNGDGVINSGDNLQFRNRFNKALRWRS